MQPKLCDCDRGTRIAFQVMVTRFDGTIVDTAALCATCLNADAENLAKLGLYPGHHEEDDVGIDVI
jgi:hypothetical protein